MSKMKFLASVPIGMLLLLLLVTSSAHAGPPGAKDDNYAVSEGGAIEFIAPGLLLNDRDPDGDQLVLSTTPQSDPAYGSLVLNPDGSFRYVHDGSESVKDFFVYEVCDTSEAHECSTALVTIIIAAVNDPPAAVDDPESVAQGGTLTKSAPGVLGNDSDIEGDVLSVSPTAPVADKGPKHGQVTLSATGGFTYTHDNSQSFEDSFDYQVCDNGAPVKCDIGTVMITISNVNDAPVVEDDEYELDEGGSLVRAAPGLLTNDSDPDGNTVSISPAYPTSGPNHGELTIGSNGSIAYFHDGSETVEDLFTYRACDNGTPKLCSSGSVRLVILPVNDPPVAIPDSGTVREGDTLTVAAPGLLKTDTDPEGDGLTVSPVPVVAPMHGSLTLAADGGYVYGHDGSETTADSFTYEVCDDGEPVACATAEVSITVEPVNDLVKVDLNGSAEGIDYEAVFSTNAGPVLIVAPTLTVKDPDDATLPSATVILAAVPDGSAESLSVVTAETSISATYNDATGVLTLTGPDSVANFQKVLRTVRYNNEVADPDTSERSAVFAVADSGGLSPAATSRIEMQDPGLAMVISPNPQQIERETDATFTVAVENVGNVDLTDVASADQFIADCDGRKLGTLKAGQTKTFDCKVERVTASFSHEIVMSGRDPLGGVVTARETAIVNLKDANIAVAITPNQQAVDRNGTAEFSVVVLNTSGINELKAVSVKVGEFNGCVRTVGVLAPGGSFSYMCQVEPVTADFTAVAIATGINADGEGVQASASAVVKMVDFKVAISAVPDRIGLQPETVTFSLKIDNNSDSIPVTLGSVIVKPFGNVADGGNPKIESTTCSDMLKLQPGESYGCSFKVVIGPPTGSFTAEAVVTAVAEGAGQISATAKWLVRIMTQMMLPMVSNQGVDEPNNIPCDAYMLLTNSPYRFFANDTSDWYRFGLAAEHDVVVQLDNFVPENGQIAIWKGTECGALSMVKMNVVTEKSTTVSLPKLAKGTYFVQILNTGELITTNRYQIEIKVD